MSNEQKEMKTKRRTKPPKHGSIREANSVQAYINSAKNRSYQGKTEALVKIILVKIIHLFISSHLQKLISV